ncbi:MAG TPA: DNA-3-methyladenine glycosylase [Nocardioides sp.]|uniref:DNA-3-methyladenine glycosylase n=1 Tax=Nocardioides sp. TaxID=35761 RepID=UPI002D8095B5|nr:DNA-3-methyladenine glycosylase [Nocardioides sp.]HET6653734.1 DNA-3-methyladenine glycosylase [Nocardioides sp.]
MPGWAELLLRPAPEVAPRLLGARLTHGGVTVRLTEVEAYDGTNDAASHAYRGPTARNDVMFGPPGRLYVYFSYGMHWCANVVCGPAGTASAVLLRAGEVVDGLLTARQRRGARPDEALARGPANLTQALGIDRNQDGLDLDGLLALPEEPVPAEDILSGPRVGVSLAHDVPWRFWLRGDRSVSAYRRSPRAPR